MNKKSSHKIFYKQLQEKLSHWQAQGWVNETSVKNILNDALIDFQGEDKSNSHKLSLILAIMGVMLLSAGAISFFAANWQGMSKLFKLSLLFSSMTGAYWAAGWALSTGQESHHLPGPKYPALGQAFLLLGVLLFGNNIMLIAQIYHIDSHYPNGIFLWVTGALITTIIMRSEAVLIAASLLALLWTGMETFDFRQIHWPWLIFLCVSTFIAIRQRAHLASHIIIITLFIWLLFNYEEFTRYATDGCIIQVYLLIGLALFMSARMISIKQIDHYFFECLSRYAFIFALIFLYILSFPSLDLYPQLSHSSNTESTSAQLSWLFIHLSLMLVITGLFFYHFKQMIKPIPIYKRLGLLWLSILFISLLSNIYFYQSFLVQYDNVTVIIVNLLLFSLVIGLICSGLAEQNHFYVNTAFVIFTITLMSRYFDTFWNLMDRSLFFIVGGLVLIFGGYWLEKKRRQLNLSFSKNQPKGNDGMGYE